MVKKRSSTSKRTRGSAKKQTKKASLRSERNPSSDGEVRSLFKLLRERFNRPDKVKLHKSFRRSYREDYRRKIEVPGIMYHIFATFRIIFKNWKLFLPFLVMVIVMNAVLVGLMSEASYQQFQDILDQTSDEIGSGDIGSFAKAGLLLISTVTTGGLSNESSEAKTIFMVLIFL